jgi:hypothetical protein
MTEYQKECAAKCPEGCVSEHDDPRISEPAALRKANREQAARIGHQRNEINNRLIEIQNLQNFKRNIERAIAECAGPDFKRRPLGGIDSLSKLVRGLRETCDRQAARIAELETDCAKAYRIVSESPLECTHLADDGSGDCDAIDDCIYHSLLRLLIPLGDRNKFSFQSKVSVEETEISKSANAEESR